MRSTLRALRAKGACHLFHRTFSTVGMASGFQNTVINFGVLMGKARAPGETPDKQRINERIRAPQVRVIGDEGDQLGVLATSEAMTLAREAGLDLVEVAPTEKPPVCRIMDYGKYKYQQKKRQHRTTTHQTKIKEIRVRPKTGKHDIEVKVSKAREFLEHKDKVLLTVMFRGRELAHVAEGRKVITDILEQLDPVAKTEAPPAQFGRRISCTLSPK